MTDPRRLSDDDRALAAELALRLLEPEQEAEALARMSRDADFAAEVRRWQEDLAAMTTELDDVAPSPNVRASLRKRLFGDEEPARGEAPRGGWFGLRGFALAAVLGVIVLALASLLTPIGPGGPVYTARLEPEQREFVLDASLVAGAEPVLELRRLDGPAAPEGRTTELWAILPDQAPVSLGVLPADAVWQVDLPEALAAQAR